MKLIVPRGDLKKVKVIQTLGQTNNLKDLDVKQEYFV